MGTLLELSCLDGIVPGEEGLACWGGGAEAVNMSRQDGRLDGKARSFFFFCESFDASEMVRGGKRRRGEGRREGGRDEGRREQCDLGAGVWADLDPDPEMEGGGGGG